MKRIVPFLFVLLMLFSFAGLAVAAEHEGETGVGEPTPIPAGRPAGAQYTPIEQRADDSGMALFTAGIFGLPIVVWLVARTVKRSRREN